MRKKSETGICKNLRVVPATKILIFEIFANLLKSKIIHIIMHHGEEKKSETGNYINMRLVPTTKRLIFEIFANLLKSNIMYVIMNPGVGKKVKRSIT